MEDALLGLNLTLEELQALRKEGFVAAERRGRAAVIFKLRFRLAGRQQARYLGADPQRAAAIRAALVVQQQPRRLEQNLKRRLASHIATAQAVLQSIKPRLAEHVLEAGFRFHGRRLRRSRRWTQQAQQSK